MSDIVEKTENGAIVYDPGIINHISEHAFQARGWWESRPVTGALRSAGRGNTLIVGDGSREFVLRHYVRGGLPGKILHDTYFWQSEEKTRSFAEWYLLMKLRRLGLPVPRPAAAHYRRSGTFYRADLLTERIQGIRSLAEHLVDGERDEAFWRAIGRGIREFHEHGVNHADLNAYNVQLDDENNFYLLDFDRGRIMPAGVWQQKNLARLERSLKKISRLDERIVYSPAHWNLLLNAYFNASRSA